MWGYYLLGELGYGVAEFHALHPDLLECDSSGQICVVHRLSVTPPHPPPFFSREGGLLKYEISYSYSLTGTFIGVGIDRKLLLLRVYVLCPIYFYLTLDPNDPDEPYAALISTTSLV